MYIIDDVTTDMSFMFHEWAVFNHPLTKWNMQSVTKMERMLENVAQDIEGWDMSLVIKTKGMYGMFDGANHLINR